MPWRPRNKYLWDFWFASKQGELHLFYLQAGQMDCHYNPDLRHDVSSVGHAVMTRQGWKEAGPDPAFSKGEEDAWDNLSIWTGSIIEKDNRFFMFYTARRKQDAPAWTPHEWQRPQNIGVAVSEDLSFWRRTAACQAGPVIPNNGNKSGLDGVAWRDPYVILGDDHNFYAFICARLNPEKTSATDAGGAIAWVKSEDLEDWDTTNIGLLVESDEFYQMEVPQVFWRKTGEGKRFYLLFCAQEKDCSRQRRSRMPEAECRTGTYYMFSRLLPAGYDGIPEINEPARLLASGLYAGKLLNPEVEANPVFFGFEWADDGGRFVGGISDPLRARFHPDGTIELADDLMSQ